MHIDLLTLYFLATGTLFAGAGMTVWERKARPERHDVLTAWAAGYTLLALGCLIAIGRHALPAPYGDAISNIVILSGYLFILHGIAVLGGRQHRLASLIALVSMGALWLVAGPAWQDALWDYGSALWIAAICAATGWEMLRNASLRALRARRIVVAATLAYALLYGARACVLPLLVSRYGAPVLPLSSAVTMYGGVLYSMVLPMALLALIREEAHSHLLELSFTDHLTGLDNRRSFFERGTQLCGHATRPLSLLAFDMDHFKAINDRYGHAAGDEVLRCFATTARMVIGPEALLARIGGEEFAALLPGCDTNEAEQIGQTVLRRFAESAARMRDGTVIKTTVSVGLAQLGAQGKSLSDLLSAADGALYSAKALGRNRVELAHHTATAVA